jgi:AbiV family abortive infection protein
MKTVRSMSKQELLRGMSLCLNNARSLQREAYLLARAGAQKRAFALTVLAMEEAGKIVLLTVASHSDRATASEETLKALTRVFRSHDAKTALLAERSWKGVLYVRRRKLVAVPRSSIRRLFDAHKSVIDFLSANGVEGVAELKLRALYVDIDNAQRRFRPPIEIPSGVLSGLLRIARSGIKDAARLRDTFRRSRTDNLADEIIAQMTKPLTLETLSRQLCGA